MKQLTLQQVVDRSRTAALPAEVLLVIFEHARTHSPICPPFPESSPIYQKKEKRRWVLLDLGAVCSRWRQVSLFTPSLWTSISLEIPPDISAPGTRPIVAALLLYFQNAGVLPLSLELFFQNFPLTSAAKKLGPIREVIFQQFVSPPAGWLPEGHGFSQLEDFSVGWPSESLLDKKYSNIPLQGITTLRRFSIHYLSNIHPSKIQLHWPNITVLHLSHFSFDKCVYLLFGCPNLVSYQCLFPFGSPSMKLHQPVILSRLENFAWPCRDDGGSHRIIEMLQFPSLKKLHTKNL